MDRFKLSADAFIHELEDNIAFTRTSPHADPLIERFQVFDEETSVLHNDCVYLCLGDALPPCKHVQPGTCIISCDNERICGDSSCTRCNLIALAGVKPATLVNRIASLFDRYTIACRELELHSTSDDGLPKFLSVAQRTLGMPLAVMDEKLDVVMTSGCKELFPNPLWETIVRDRKPQRSELLDNQNGRIYQLRSRWVGGTSPHDVNVHVHTFADYDSASCNIYLRGVPTATIWAFQTKPNQHFEPHQANLLAWMAQCLKGWIVNSKLIQPSRGQKRERYLIDLVRGDFGTSDSYAQEAGRQVGVKAVEGPEYQLMIFKPADAVRPEHLLKTLEQLEAAVPDSVCVLKEIGIVMLLPMGTDEYLSDQQQQEIEGICRRNSLFGILSATYHRLCDSPAVLQQIHSCYRYIDVPGNTSGLYHYYDYMVRQSMHLVLGKQPKETMLHPLIRTLMAYDHRCHTDYLETFKVYLNNRCNVTDTAKQLHMHRNTLLHRVKRIEELLGTTFAESWELRRMLMLSFDYLYLDENKGI